MRHSNGCGVCNPNPTPFASFEVYIPTSHSIASLHPSFSFLARDLFTPLYLRATMAAKRKHADLNGDDDPVDPADELMFLCLGGGNEVGRSCHIVQYKGKTVMLDAGMHPAYDGLAALPFYDDFDLSTVDVLLISHFHVDHAASLPYVLAKTNFKGRVFMTHPTKAIYKWLIQDSVRVGNLTSSAEQRTALYSETDHLSTFPLIEAIDYYTTHTVSSIRITPYPAGHVLGAAMFVIEIAGLSILFTGDYSREEDRHLVSATIPKGLKIDVLICESTFGTALHVPRPEREAALMKAVTGILDRGGRVLMPVFALGTAQELLLILDEYWSRHPKYHQIPIYYASNLARKCMVVYQTYISAMNDNIKRLFRERMAEAEANGEVAKTAGPWDFRFVRSLRSLERFEDVGGCVMLATPGMMQNGASRELLERWAPDSRNGVVVTGYSVEGTMAQMILNEPDHINAVMTRGNMRRGLRDDDAQIPRRCSVQEYSFAAHVDGQQNKEFVEEVGAAVVILVHGARQQMTRFKSKLLSLNANKSQPVKVYSPANCEELRIPFRTDKMAKVVGKLAQVHPALPSHVKEQQILSGVLVQNEFKLSLMAPEDLREYAGLTTTTVICRQHMALRGAGVDLIRWALRASFGNVDEEKAESNGSVKKEDADEEIPRARFVVLGCVTVTMAGREVELEWEGNMLNDGIADAVLGVLLNAEKTPAAVKHSAKPCLAHRTDERSPQERLDRLFLLLESQFGGNVRPLVMDGVGSAKLQEMGIPIPGLEVRMGEQVATVSLEDMAVESKSVVLKGRVEAVMREALEGVGSLWG
ncbi:cleavage and polyadenylation specifity factor [Trichodelitschia bisporula]|uniref:Cleavage and polyadenylation specifity factor n=1 Tax=Trichodelitschia bisporula TaxID=703511 RepID=A0A6G1HKF4_9PEZI|nr:cleavage and polyadenylation specifity factor [Trichodelitschia bisporula]